MKQRIRLWIIIVASLFGLGTFGYAGWQLFFGGSAERTPQEVETVQGQITRIETDRSRNGRVLKVYLLDQPARFESSKISYACINQKALERLKPGQMAQVATRPRKDETHRYFPRIIYSLSAGEISVLSLNDYNRCARANANLGKIVDPLMLGLSFYLLVYSTRRLARLRERRRILGQPV